MDLSFTAHLICPALLMFIYMQQVTYKIYSVFKKTTEKLGVILLHDVTDGDNLQHNEAEW